MRCVHCGKEVRDNVIFCIGCGRAVKREYEKYCNEVYNEFSLKGKILKFIDRKNEQQRYDSKTNTKTKKYSQSDTNNSIKREASQKISEASESLKGILSFAKKWIEDNMASDMVSSDSSMDQLDKSAWDDTRVLGNNNKPEIIESANKENLYEDNDSFNNNDSFNDNDSYEFDTNADSESNSDKLWDTAKMILSLIGVVIVFMSSCYDSGKDTSYTKTSYSYETDIYENYEFPDNPQIDEYIGENIDDSVTINKEFIVNYLTMLNEDISMFDAYDNPLHSLEEYDSYNTELSSYVEGEEDSYISDIVFIYKLWEQELEPLYDNTAQLSEEEIDEKVQSFKYEFNTIAEYYLEED